MALFDRFRRRQEADAAAQDAMAQSVGMGQVYDGQGVDSTGAINGFRALAAPIGQQAVLQAAQTLRKYKEGKANLETRIVENEQWYKLRHWECMRKSKPNMVEPTSGWLFNCIEGKLADAMDNYPSINVLPREKGDVAESQRLSSIIPVILDQNEFEQTYEDVWLYKLKTGTGVYGVTWDKTRHNGLGDISIKKVDVLCLFWEPGITDIQRSRNVFEVSLVDNDALVAEYPQLTNKLGSQTLDVAKYIYDDAVDTTNKSVVVDWYYKRINSAGKQVVHFCKFVNDEVLYATENDPEYAERGLYDHGRYPYEFDTLFSEEGTIAGFGYVDVAKSSQEYIDRGNQAIMQNMLANARPRHFIRSDGSVNETEYADITKDFIHVDGQLGQDSILPVTSTPLASIYLSVIQEKIDELKETTGNRDVSNGGTTGGATAASAVAAMQEAGSRLSRLANKASYRVFQRICLDVIELIRQFYDWPRCFRIMGQNGTVQYITYKNAELQPQEQGTEFGVDMGMRVPLFDIEVTAQKASPYSQMSQNELAMQFYAAGFFNPALADQALACIDMMDFDRKSFVQQKIAQNGGMLQQMMMLAAMIDGGKGEISQGLAAQYGVQGAAYDNAETSAVTAETGGGESKVTKDARQRVADSTAPR